jgi:hypothetical protein
MVERSMLNNSAISAWLFSPNRIILIASACRITEKLVATATNSTVLFNLRKDDAAGLSLSDSGKKLKVLSHASVPTPAGNRAINPPLALITFQYGHSLAESWAISWRAFWVVTGQVPRTLNRWVSPLQRRLVVTSLCSGISWDLLYQGR